MAKYICVYDSKLNTSVYTVAADIYIICFRDLFSLVSLDLKNHHNQSTSESSAASNTKGSLFLPPHLVYTLSLSSEIFLIGNHVNTSRIIAGFIVDSNYYSVQERNLSAGSAAADDDEDSDCAAGDESTKDDALLCEDPDNRATGSSREESMEAPGRCSSSSRRRSKKLTAAATKHGNSGSIYDNESDVGHGDADSDDGNDGFNSCVDDDDGDVQMVESENAKFRRRKGTKASNAAEG